MLIHERKYFPTYDISTFYVTEMAIRDYFKFNLEYVKKIRSDIESFKPNSALKSYMQHNEDLEHDILLTIFDLHHSSLFVHTYSLIEKHFFLLAQDMEQGKKIKLSDFQGRGINKFKKYIELNSEIPFTAKDEEFKQLLSFGSLRNILVHHPEQAIKNNHKDLKDLKMLAKLDNFRIYLKNEYYHFAITEHEFIDKLLKLGQKLIEFIYYEQPEKLD